MRFWSALVLVTGCACTGCGGEAFQSSAPTPSQDASAEAAPDASSEAAPDGSVDAESPDQMVTDTAVPDTSGQDAVEVDAVEVDAVEVDAVEVDAVEVDAPQEAGCATGATQTCYDGSSGTEGVGLCHAGTSTCTAGVWGPCEGQVVPTDELCDNLDNDCNGVRDNGIDEPWCYTGPDGTAGIGACQLGTSQCVSGQTICGNEVVPVEEICGNGIDENCDGEDLLCVVCAEAQPLIYPAICGANCLDAQVDADCDGMRAGDPTSTCNPLLFFDGFRTQPNPVIWTLTGATAWECGGLRLLPTGGTGLIQDPAANPGPDNIVEARVKLGPTVTGDWRVGIRSAVATDQFRTCEIWYSSMYSGSKVGLHMVVDGTNSGPSGVWTQTLSLDGSPGKSYVLRLSGKGASNVCSVLDEAGNTVLDTLSLSATFTATGSVTVYSVTREARVDYFSVYGW